MADPSSFRVGNAPQGASYAAPLLDFSALANAPQTIFNAQQNARKTALQNAFPNGLAEFKDANGQYNIGAISDRLTKIGGAEYAKETLPLLLQQQIATGIGQSLNDIDKGLAGGGSQGPAPAGSAAPAAQPRSAPVVQPTSSPAAGSANITGDFQQRQQQLEGSNRPNAPSGASGSPAPVGGAAPQSVPQQDAMGAAGQPFSQYPATIQRYDQAIAHIHALGVQAGVAKNPELQKSLEAKAAGLQANRDKLFEEYQKHLEPTTEQRNITSGALEQGEQLKAEIARGNKAYEGINGASEQYGRDLKPYLDISRGLMSDPAMQSYTGGGAEFKMAANRLLNAIGLGDPKTLALQETLKKVTAAGVLSQININRDQMTEAGGSAGRIFKATIDKIDQAVPQLSTSPGGNRALIEIQSRLGEQSQRVAEMARAYVTPIAQGGLGHSHLDPGFDTMLAKYLETHPAFSKEEIANPTLLTLPSAPTTTHNDQQAFFQWAKAMGIKPGALVATGDGRYKKVIFPGNENAPVRANTGTAPANAAPQ